MKLDNAMELLKGENLTTNIDVSGFQINHAFAADLLSDVLALTEDRNTTLITGTTNFQVLRVSEILSIDCIIFVRGKYPSDEVIAQAEGINIPMIKTDKTMYETCGLLWERNIKPCKYKPFRGK